MEVVNIYLVNLSDVKLKVCARLMFQSVFLTVYIMPNTHRRRRRDKTVSSRRRRRYVLGFTALKLTRVHI